MKNSNTFPTLEFISSQAMASVKGGATIQEINDAFQKGYITEDQRSAIFNDITMGTLDPRSLTGEWWGAGSL